MRLDSDPEPELLTKKQTAQKIVGQKSDDECDIDHTAQFVELLTSHQSDLFAYVSTLLFGDSIAADVLQETNLKLWAHAAEFDWGRPFLPWAYGFAYQQVLKYRKSRQRSRLVLVSDEVLDAINTLYCSDHGDVSSRMTALVGCLKKLNSDESTLIHERYVERLSVKMLASRFGGSVNQISVRLYRVRRALAKCVQNTLALEN